MNVIFNLLLAHDVHTTRKIKSTHAIFFITYYYFIFIFLCKREELQSELRLFVSVTVCRLRVQY